MRTITYSLVALSFAACSGAPADAPRADAECATCHPTQAAAFVVSAHARAPESDLFRALRDRADPDTRAFCDRCHAPHAAPGERGVGCVTCHTAIATRGVSNGRLVMGDGDEMLGGFDDARATPAHASRRSGFIRSADLCGTCHEVAGPGALVETPYTEWSRSPARAAGVTCVDCHMSTSPGTTSTAHARGPAATDGPERQLSDHAFVGPEHPRASELLQRAAAIAVAVTGRDGDALAIDVTVTNRNPGHALPSGARFAREVWVELVAVDALGGRHIVTGGLDARGAPVEGDTQRIDLGDRVTRSGVAALPLDADAPAVRAIPAGERRAYRLRVPAAWEGVATVSLAARLRYRRNAWALRDALGLAPDVSPPVDLARAEVAAP